MGDMTCCSVCYTSSMCQNVPNEDDPEGATPLAWGSTALQSIDSAAVPGMPLMRTTDPGGVRYRSLPVDEYAEPLDRSLKATSGSVRLASRIHSRGGQYGPDPSMTEPQSPGFVVVSLGSRAYCRCSCCGQRGWSNGRRRRQTNVKILPECRSFSGVVGIRTAQDVRVQAVADGGLVSCGISPGTTSRSTC